MTLYVPLNLRGILVQGIPAGNANSLGTCLHSFISRLKPMALSLRRDDAVRALVWAVVLSLRTGETEH